MSRGQRITAASLPPAWFRAELEALLPVLRRYAHKLFVTNKADARDLVQETCVHALEKHANFARGTNMASWLLTMMHNLFVNEMRRRARLPPLGHIDEALAVLVAPTQEQAIRCRDIMGIYRTLDPKQRLTLDAICGGRYKYEATAAMMHVPVGTVRSRLSRGRDHMRRTLKERGVL